MPACLMCRLSFYCINNTSPPLLDVLEAPRKEHPSCTTSSPVLLLYTRVTHPHINPMLLGGHAIM